MKQREAEVYEARVAGAKASWRKRVISLVREERVGWGRGAGLYWVLVCGMPAF